MSLAFHCLVILCTLSLTFLQPDLAHAAWLRTEDAPLHIRRHDRVIQVAPISQGGTFRINGVLEIKINTDQGRALVSRYKFPITDELEDVKIHSAEFFEPGLGNAPSLSKAVASDGIFLEPVEDKSVVRPLNPFDPARKWIIRFGDLKVGSVLRITYEISNRQARIMGLFSRAFTWGTEYPEFGGSISIESKEPIYIDASRSAREKNNPLLSFTQGKLPDGNFLYKIELKAPVYRKFDGEQGGAISTAQIPRVQVSNQSSWVGVLDVLVPKFQPPLNDPMPSEIGLIVDAAKAIPTIDERINLVVERLQQAVRYTEEWSRAEGGLTPQSLSDMVRLKRADSKDYAYLTSVALRAAGVQADVALVWKQNPTERLFIEELPTTPAFESFNHAVVRVLDQGKTRFFDPSIPVVYTEGPLSDIQGSWALTLTRAGSNFERVPIESPLATSVRISQIFDIRPDTSISASGRVQVEGPMAAELKILALTQGQQQLEPYIRSLFGLATKAPRITPTMQIDNRDRRGRHFDINFSFVGTGLISIRGEHRDVDLSVPGIVGLPSLAAGPRATDLILSKNLNLDIETRFRNSAISDETQTSCISLTSFASVIRETRETPDGFLVTEAIRFKQDRIPANSVHTKVFKDELASYLGCVSRAKVAIGPRPSYEDAMFTLSPDEAASLKKPISLFNLQDIKTLSLVDSRQLNPVIRTKIFLSMRDMIRRGLTSPQIRLEYVDALVNSGLTPEGRYLPLHLKEAGKLFIGIGKEMIKNPRYHRVHARMLFADGRPKEALVAIQNAMSLEKDISADFIMMAEIQQALGNKTQVENFLNRAANMRGPRATKVSALERLANFYLTNQNGPEFSKTYSRALYEAPKNPWVFGGFAWGLIQFKQFDQAIQNARRASQILRTAEFDQTLSLALIKKAETLYFTSPGVATTDLASLRSAEALAVECLKYSRSHALAFRIAGHASFLKAMAGDYASLIATQSYFAKAIELGMNDPWTVDRYQAASQALSTGASIASIWNVLETSRRSRVPANQPAARPAAPDSTNAPKK